MKLRDCLWLWGHGRQCENIKGQIPDLRGRPGIGRLSCAEAARYMGIPNICRIVLEPEEAPPYDAELRASSDMQHIVWSALGCGVMEPRDDTEELIKNAKEFPMLSGALVDDFFPNTNELKTKLYTPAVLRGMRQRLHHEAGRRLDFWVVVYQWDFAYQDICIKDYLDEFDVATLWTYHPRDLEQLDATYESMRRHWGYDRPLYAGCYMWNFPEKKPMDMQALQKQLATYLQWLKQGKIEGIIFCHNYVVDLGLEAVEYVKQWIRDYGDEEI